MATVRERLGRVLDPAVSSSASSTKPTFRKIPVEPSAVLPFAAPPKASGESAGSASLLSPSLNRTRPQQTQPSQPRLHAGMNASPAVGSSPYGVTPLSGLYVLPQTSANGDDNDTENTPLPVDERGREHLPRNRWPLEAQLANLANGSDPLPCTKCVVHVDSSEKTSLYVAEMTFDVGGAYGQPFAFIFPVGECGKVETMLVSVVGQRPLIGEMARVSRRDGRLILARDVASFLRVASDEDEEDGNGVDLARSQGSNGSDCGAKEKETTEVHAHDAAPSQKAESQQQQRAQKANKEELKKKSRKHKVPPLYYYLCVDASHQLSLGTRANATSTEGSSLVVKVQWRTKDITQYTDRDDRVFSLGFSYLCFPRIPDEVRFKLAFSKPIRRLSSPNGAGIDVVYMQDGRASVVADHTSGLLRAIDYAFVLNCRVGDTKFEPMTVQPFGVVAIVALAFIGALYYFTHQLEL